ncbi:DUF3332 family protein [Desulfoluna spongiiphila]|uniref:DUF3332 domain-containing protein n=1 Tax=Desulfoluna spongiiphila TaxID=419481 RepID=A0A1G5C6P3_9BACT|nr:DUF3332 family protein [Desulfoluna spongiiphila]SCX98072.1 protein of unknown function [Desulfoluna spongiiphila]
MKKTTGLLIGFLIAMYGLGCMGQMGLSQKAIGVNLKLVDNRYGRAGIYILGAPVYAVTSIIDLFIINSIEFWTGTNPITKKKPAIVDTPVDAWMKVDDNLDPAATEAPLSSTKPSLESIDIAPSNNDTLKMDLRFNDGTHQSVVGIRDPDGYVKIYVDDRLVALATHEALLRYVSSIPDTRRTTVAAKSPE